MGAGQRGSSRVRASCLPNVLKGMHACEGEEVPGRIQITGCVSIIELLLLCCSTSAPLVYHPLSLC